MKLSESRMEQLCDLWCSFNADVGVTVPSKENIRRFVWYMEEHDGSFEVKDVVDWVGYYFIPESISWIDNFNGRL